MAIVPKIAQTENKRATKINANIISWIFSYKIKPYPPKSR